MILWNYVLGEVLTDIHALADYFSVCVSSVNIHHSRLLQRPLGVLRVAMLFTIWCVTNQQSLRTSMWLNCG